MRLLDLDLNPHLALAGIVSTLCSGPEILSARALL